MRKALIVGIIIWGILSFAGLSWASPFLACDWTTGVTASEVEVNGTVIPGTVVQSGTEKR